MAADRGEHAGVRIFLVDDHPAVCEGLSLLLRQVGHTVCGEAHSQAELLANLDAARADMVVLDPFLAEESGPGLLDCLTARGVPTLVYSMREDRRGIERVLARGALGYVTKREGVEVLLQAIAAVSKGQRFVSPSATRP